MASSFDGSMDSAVGAVQELSANLGGLGPVGAGAGLVIAGAAGAMFSAWQQRTEDMKALVASMYDDMAQSGEDFLSEEFIRGEVDKIVSGADDAAAAWDVVKRGASAAGVDIGVALRAVSGDGEAAAEVMQAVKARAEELGEGASSSNVDLNGLAYAIEHTGSAAVETAERVDAGRAAMRASGEAAREYDQAVAGMGETLAAATERIEANNTSLTDAEARAAANTLALGDLSGELIGVKDAAVAAGVSGDELNRVQRDNLAAFLAAAKAAGLNADEARELARRYDLVPDNVSTTVSTPGMDAAIERAEKLASIVRNTPSHKVITFEGRTIGTGQLVGYVPGTGTPIYGAARAGGGPVEAGETYLVGEHGPEVVTMGQAGSVTRNVDVGGRGGPVDLSDRSIRKLAAAILEGAAVLSHGAVADNNRAQRLAGRTR